MKNDKFKTSFVIPKGAKTKINKTGITFMSILLILKKGSNTMQYMIFQYDWELALI